MNRLAQVKKERKAKQPNFHRNIAVVGTRPRIKNNWRKPQGKQNKIRLCKRGKPAMVRSGYGSPSELRGLTRSLHKLVYIHSTKDIDGLKTDELAVIPSDFGTKKKLQFLHHLKQKGKNAHNYNSIDDAIKTIEDELKFRKDYRKNLKSRVKLTLAKKEEQKKAATVEKKESAETPVESKEAKEEERKEVEKILIHNQ